MDDSTDLRENTSSHAALGGSMQAAAITRRAWFHQLRHTAGTHDFELS
jgi:hypothetical protein